MSRKCDITEGQIFRRLGPGGGLWQVMTVRRDGVGMPHAQMQRADDPKTLKTLAIAALQDASQFERMNKV
ncbi:MAG: hypothetical protein WCF85_12515 [Rhodospirillaceae bacterium]